MLNHRQIHLNFYLVFDLMVKFYKIYSSKQVKIKKSREKIKYVYFSPRSCTAMFIHKSYFMCPHLMPVLRSLESFFNKCNVADS